LITEATSSSLLHHSLGCSLSHASINPSIPSIPSIDAPAHLARPPPTMRVQVSYLGEPVELELNPQGALSSIIELACSSLQVPGDPKRFALYVVTGDSMRMLTAQVPVRSRSLSRGCLSLTRRDVAGSRESAVRTAGRLASQDSRQSQDRSSGGAREPDQQGRSCHAEEGRLRPRQDAAHGTRRSSENARTLCVSEYRPSLA